MKLSNLKLKSYKSKYYDKHSSNVSTENRKHEIALQISNVGLWDWNIEKNNVYYSEESKRILGYSGDELKSTSKVWDEKVHPDDKALYYSHFQLHLKGDLDLYQHEYRILGKEGLYRWVLDKGRVVERDSNGKAIRIVGTHTDVTDRKKHETQLKNNLELITSQNKRLHNFTHIVSHNLKTHIGNFKNILEFYEDTSNVTEKEDLIGHLKSISEALTTTIVDLDDIISIKSKININELNERVNLHSCINKILESLKIDSIDKEVMIHNALRKDESLFTNQPYLESIFYNLISNGIKYSDPNKKSQIIIQSIHTKDTVKILISDNGIGIDLIKFKRQLFEMYQTFHGTDRKDSRGIGLYITKTQVEALHGVIEIESTLGEGTAFSIDFKNKSTLNRML